VGSYAGEIPQFATKTKNNNRIERHIGVDMGRFTSGTHQQGHQKLCNETKTIAYVGTGGGHIEHKLRSNIKCA